MKVYILNTQPKEKEERALQEEGEERDELRLGADYAKVGVNEVGAKSPPQLTTEAKAKVGPPRPNSDFPAMSECLEVVFQPGKGRHVVAKRDIQG